MIISIKLTGIDAGMVDWQITATTLFCDAVGDEVTVMVYQDWSVKCTGHRKYGEPGRNNQSPKVRQSKGKAGCAGPGCSRVIQYKEKLFSEESKRGIPNE